MHSGSSVDVLILMPSLEDRTVLWRMLRKEEHINVVAVTTDPRQAQQQIRLHQPSVLLISWELPCMSVSDFLNGINDPPRLIAVSSRQTQQTLDGLARGDQVLLAMNHQGMEPLLPVIRKAIFKPSVRLARQSQAPPKHMTRIIAIGASTGGSDALRTIIGDLQAGLPPILVVQHMPKNFTTMFAKNLNDMTSLEVTEVTHTVQPRPNHMYIAPGDRHLTLARRDGGWWLELDDGPEVMRHRPSVNKLFQSVAQIARASALGVLLTGMGADGARGLLAMHQAGAATLVQDQQSCVVFGMPKEALALGAAKIAVPLSQVASHINRCKVQPTLLRPRY